jgi:hypothetical protein
MLVQTGAWPGVGPFQGSGNELTDASKNKLVLETNRDQLTSAEMSVTDKPKTLLKMQVAVDFLLESVGATPARISDFNTQLSKSRPELTASSQRNPLSLATGRYVVSIYPESAHKDMVNFIVKVNSKEVPLAAPSPAAEVSPRAAAAPATANSNVDGTDSRTDGTPTLYVPPSPPSSSPPSSPPSAIATKPNTKVTPSPIKPTKKPAKPAQPAADTAFIVVSPSEAKAPASTAQKPSQTLIAAKPTDLAPRPTGESAPSAAETPLDSKPAETLWNQKPPEAPADLKPEFTDVISDWQQVKRTAVKNLDTAVLEKVLAGKALARQAQFVKWLQDTHKHCENSSKNISVDRYTELAKGEKYSVFAQVTETSKLVDDSSNEVIKDTTSTYKVNYTIEKIDGHWTISDSEIIPANAQSAAKTPRNASR